jgi:H/ACA ribonucleoprotein complex subunit 3
MRLLMRKCPSCKRYTLKESCPACGGRTVSPHPPRFSPEDKYADYRARSIGIEDLDKGDSREDG